MPDLSNIEVPLYSPEQPYHWEYDNLPLKALIKRQELINSAVDNNSDVLRDAQGTQGSLSNRLNQSIDEDGNIKASAVNAILHSIGAHEDGEYEGIDYVRMLASERDKLNLIADEATDMTIQIEGISQIVLFEQGPIIFEGSDSVTWEVSNSNHVKAHLGFPLESAHRHYYSIVPVTSDYTSFTTNMAATAYVEGSLRVYINGTRIFEDVSIYAPGPLPTDAWVLNSYTSDFEAGSFVLDVAITEDDVIMIDFDVSLV
jgi:hypothetical protein